MKIKRFLAALLCYAMVFTQAVPANAALLEEALSGNEIAGAYTELSEGAAETAVEPVLSADEVYVSEDDIPDIAESDITLDEELIIDDGDMSEEPGELSADGLAEDIVETVSGDNIAKDGADPSPFFSVDSTGTLVLNGYSSLNNVTDATVVIPKEVKRIPADTALFMGNTSVKTVQFESGNDGSELVIEPGAFSGSNIEYFYSPSNLKTIPANAFSGCSSLIYFSFYNIEIIGDNAFNGCRKLGSDLTKLKGYKKVISIGNNAFANTGFTTLTISDIVATKDVLVGEGAFNGCINLNTANIPASFTGIPGKCFEGCTSLVTVNIKCGGVIGADAFKNCKKLKTVDFGKVTGIEENAFLNCIALVSVEFPTTIDGADEDNMVKAGAFNGCSAIKKIRFNYNGEATERELVEYDAFPEAVGVEVKGYLDTLKKYVQRVNVNASKKWTYVSLQSSYSFSISETVARNCGVIVTVGNKDTALTKTTQSVKITAGARIGLKISQKTKDFSIKGGSLNLSGDDNCKFTFVSYSGYQYVYYVTMPEHDSVFDFDTFSSKALAKKYLKYEIINDDPETHFVPYGNDIAIDYGTGKKGQIAITSSYEGETIRLCEGLFTYKSSNTSVAAVDSKTGAVTVLKEGKTTITATYKNNTSVKLSFILYSNGTAAVDKDSLSLTVDGDDPESVEAEYIFDEEESVAVNIVSYERNELSTGDRKFKIKLNVSNDKAQPIYVNAKWTSSDTKIAKLSSAENMTNSNTVTILKNAYGEALITASVKYKTSTYYAYMVIRVVDSAPKVLEDAITVESEHMASDVYGGSQLTLVPVKGFDLTSPDIMGNNKDGSIYPKLYQLNSKSGKYEEREGFKLLYVGVDMHDHYIYRLIPTGKGLVQGIGVGKSKEFTGDNKLYIRCAKEDDSNDYYIPITKVKVTRVNPVYSLKMSGKINLHYNSLCYAPLVSDNGFNPEEDLERKKAESDEDYTKRYIKATIGEVVFKNPITVYGDGLLGVELVSKDHYSRINKNNGRYVEYANDKFAANFKVFYDDSLKEWHIRRSGTELKQENGKDVVSGYILYYYKGMTTIAEDGTITKDKFLVAPITIPTASKAPKYYLSTKSVTDSQANLPGVYTFKFQNDIIKKKDLSSNSIEKVELAVAKDHTRFAAPTEDDGTITLNASRLPEGKSVARINVKKKNWEKAAGYDFTVNITTKDPTVSISPKKLTLNSNKDDDTGEIKVKLDQIGTEIHMTEPVYAGNGTDPGISFDYDTDETPNIMVVKPTVPQGTAKGSYKYKSTVSYNLYGKSERVLKTISFTVAVVRTQPSIKLDKTAFTFNFGDVSYAEAEIFKPTVTVKSMTVLDKENDLPDVSNKEVVPIKPKKEQAVYAQEVGEKINIVPAYDEDTKKQYFEITLGDVSGLPLSSFNFNYEIRGITLYGAEFKPIKITVKGTTKDPAVLVTASGKLNTLDETSCIKYTMKVKNFSMPSVDPDIDVLEYNPDTYEMEASTHFYAEQNAKNQLVTELYSNLDTNNEYDSEKGFEYKKTYEIQLVYRINGVPVTTKTINVKPVQTEPSYKLTPGKLHFVSTLGSEEIQRQMATEVVTKTSVLHAHVTGAKVNSSNSKLLRDAFTVTYIDDDDDGEIRNNLRSIDKECIAGRIEVTCRNPELLTKGKTYKLKVDLKTDGQAWDEVKQKDGSYEWEKVKGTTLEIPVVVTR